MINRALAGKIQASIHQMPVISITGPRQSGKTTLCKQDYFYANLESRNPDIWEDPNCFLQQGENGMIIDDQYAPELFSYIQAKVDERGRNGEFILSGSQNFLFMERISQSLAGRVAIFHLLPFGLNELKGTDHHPGRFGFILKGISSKRPKYST